MISFLTESTNFEETATVGGFNSNSDHTSFDAVFESTYDDMMGKQIDVMADVTTLVKNDTFLEAYKNSLLGNLKDECDQMDGETSGTHKYLYEQVSDMFDNCANDLVLESTKVGQLLPIKAIDFPILIKQHLKIASKDIMQTEVTKSPIIKKHIEQTYVVSNQDKTKRWKYPQCFFNDDFKEIFDEGKGLKIKSTPVTLPQMDYDIPKNLTDSKTPGRENITMALEIIKATVKLDEGGTETADYVFPTPMRINPADGTLLGGLIDADFKKSGGDSVHVKDVITGTVDFVTNTICISSAAQKVASVVFSGYLSNEKNERAVGFDYQREEREFKIEDGFRMNVPYSLEELQDAKALLTIDLYQKTFNNMGDVMTDMEDSKLLAWLDEMYDRYKGVELDPLGWDGFVTESTFSCDSTSLTTALPSQYIAEMLKFKIDGMIIDMCDKAKLEDFTFVIYGNPRYIRFLSPQVNWVTKPGSTLNGVKLDYGYGIMTSGDVKVQVVSTKKVNAKYDKGSKTHDGLRLIPFPISQEQMTFKHYKYTTHILTQANSAYRAPDLPGGSMTNLMGVSRYTNAAIQAMQGKLKLAECEKYIDASSIVAY